VGRLLHAMPHVAAALAHRSGFIATLIAEAVDAKDLATGASLDERARYVLAAFNRR